MIRGRTHADASALQPSPDRLRGQLALRRQVMVRLQSRPRFGGGAHFLLPGGLPALEALVLKV